MTNNDHDLECQYPSFVVPAPIYEVIFIHENTTSGTMKRIIKYARLCEEYTFDTESEMSNNQLAVVQIQTISDHLPLLMIVVELTHLPSRNSPLHEQIQEFFQLVLRTGNRLYCWGSLEREIQPAVDYYLFDWPVRASMINIQEKFSDWYQWALSHCEVCSLDTRSGITVSINGSNRRIDSITVCNCHRPSPYQMNELWSLQKALGYSYGMFIEKTTTINHWSWRLDPEYSIMSKKKQNNMIRYAIYDCFATTCLSRAVLKSWTFQQFTKIKIVDIFTTKISLRDINIQSERSKPNQSMLNQSKPKQSKFNQSKLMEIIDYDLELISEDEEIFMNQCIQIETSKSPSCEPISDDEIIPHRMAVKSNDEQNVNNHTVVVDAQEIEQEVPPVTFTSHSGRRSVPSKKRRNKKRNQVRRLRRYDQYIIRPIFHKFRMKLIKKILDNYDIDDEHVKLVGENLVIGIRKRASVEENEQKLPRDAFNQYNYYKHRHQSCRRLKRRQC